MLETILSHIHNWFPAGGYPLSATARGYGRHEIKNGELIDTRLRPGQYYRIRGSVFNDGLHQHPDSELIDEAFDGEVWALAVPRAVVDLAHTIAVWREKNPETDKVSESFGGYSYTRGSSGTAGGAVSGWQSVFASSLNPWRRPYDD